MRSDTLATLGVGRSFSRPHVSDDHPFSEAQFKTLKYQPDYPGRFAGLLDARGWLEPFFGWHNDDHQHSGLALCTPAKVFFGRVAVVHAARQEALDAAYAPHPSSSVTTCACARNLARGMSRDILAALGRTDALPFAAIVGHDCPETCISCFRKFSELPHDSEERQPA